MRISVKRGLRLELSGAPSQVVDDRPKFPKRVALLGGDYPGLRAVLDVAEGERVRRGQTLFHDRRDPPVKFTAPASGTVVAIQRGPRRKLVSVTIEVDDGAPLEFAAFAADSLSRLDARTVRGQLLDSGLWTAIRTRPYDCVPASDSAPAAIFITAIDTHPLAGNPAVVLAERPAAFADGVAVLCALGFPVYVCKAPEAALPRLCDAARIVEFAGAHPAGLPGTHIDLLARVSDDARAWHIGYQDVIAVGRLFAEGRVFGERVIALGGDGVERPRLVRSLIGCSLEDLLHGEDLAGDAHVYSGSPLSGRAVSPDAAWLGRYHLQVAVLPGTAPGLASAPRAQAARRRAVLPVEAFERVWPFASPVLPLLRAIDSGDSALASSLGCLALAEEDMACCNYVCPSGIDYSAALRDVLNDLAADIRR